MKRRKVKFIKYVRSEPDEVGAFTSTPTEVVGDFVEWGVDHEEFESGAGNYSIALIEMPDGSVEGVHYSRVKFLDNGEIKG